MINLTKPNKNEEETCTFSSLCCYNVDSDRCMGTIPRQITDRSQSELYKDDDRGTETSDEAWEKALPIVLKEAKEGRPYISWAGRPYDLPQARIPSFPVLKEVECIVSVVVEVK